MSEKIEPTIFLEEFNKVQGATIDEPFSEEWRFINGVAPIINLNFPRKIIEETLLQTYGNSFPEVSGTDLYNSWLEAARLAWGRLTKEEKDSFGGNELAKRINLKAPKR